MVGSKEVCFGFRIWGLCFNSLKEMPLHQGPEALCSSSLSSVEQLEIPSSPVLLKVSTAEDRELFRESALPGSHPEISLSVFALDPQLKAGNKDFHLSSCTLDQSFEMFIRMESFTHYHGQLSFLFLPKHCCLLNVILKRKET